jgi:hypothetical protein
MSFIIIAKIVIGIAGFTLTTLSIYGLYYKKDILKSVELIKRFHQVESSIK